MNLSSISATVLGREPTTAFEGKIYSERQTICPSTTVNRDGALLLRTSGSLLYGDRRAIENSSEELFD